MAFGNAQLFCLARHEFFLRWVLGSLALPRVKKSE